MFKDLYTIKPYSSAFLADRKQIMTINNWLHEKFGPYGNRWTIKSVAPGHTIRVAAVVSFAKESHQTLFQLTWSDTYNKFYHTVEECFDDQ